MQCLLVANSYLGPILPRFRDTAAFLQGFCSKNDYRPTPIFHPTLKQKGRAIKQNHVSHKCQLKSSTL